MRKWMVGCAAAAAMGLGATAASAQMAASSSMASHSSMSAMAPHTAMGSMASSHMASSHMASSHMASSAGHSRETKMDVMMVHNCWAMPHRKMLKDLECRDYMKHHPDWMKRRR